MLRILRSTDPLGKPPGIQLDNRQICSSKASSKGAGIACYADPSGEAECETQKIGAAGTRDQDGKEVGKSCIRAGSDVSSRYRRGIEVVNLDAETPETGFRGSITIADCIRAQYGRLDRHHFAVVLRGDVDLNKGCEEGRRERGRHADGLRG